MAIKKENNLNISIFAALKVSEVSGIPVLLLSNPGVGKTTTVYLFAKQRGYEVVELRGNSTTAEEVNGYDVSPSNIKDGEVASAIHLRPSWFQDVLKNHDRGLRTLLFLDEITTANEFVQAALLKVIFDRSCGKELLPSDTLIVSAGNYSENLASTMTLLAPTMNRFMIYNIIPDDSDVDVILNKFTGSAIGKKSNYFDELSKVLAEIDSNQRIVSSDIYNKIGENFELAIKAAFLQITSHDSLIDMKITDLRGIYSDITTDKVHGFISFRTLSYLRDVAISWYLCFGKEGIDSLNFRNAIDGLCGIGMNRVKVGKSDYNVESVPVKVGEYFHNYLKGAANDCEKLENTQFTHFSDYFAEWVNSNGSAMSAPSITAAVNKINELIKIPELRSIERPIDEAVLTSILEMSSKYVSEHVSKVLRDSVDKFNVEEGKVNMDTIPVDQLAGLISEVNKTVELFLCSHKLINDSSRGYSKDISNRYNQLVGSNLRIAFASVQSTVKMLKRTSPEKADLLPTVSQLKL